MDHAFPRPLKNVALITLANVIATETDGIQRFQDRPPYTSSSGLSPTVHSSGGKTRTGRMVPPCHRWLKGAYIEAARVAVGCSAHFGGPYRYHRQRGKSANTAITIVARRIRDKPGATARVSLDLDQVLS